MDKVLSGARFTNVPEGYIRTESERPRLSEVVICGNIPVVELGCDDRGKIMEQICDACKSYGFFQVVNHGVSPEAAKRMLDVVHEFFTLPVEEKMKLYSQDPSKTMRLSTSFNMTKGEVHNWRDCLPEWHSNPPASRPESEPPRQSEVVACDNIHVIDLSCDEKGKIVEQICNACKSYGFFQVINHGLSAEAVKRMLDVAHEFFTLPAEEKMKLYSDDPSKAMRLSTSFNMNKEKVHNWRDYLRLHCNPLDKCLPEWPSNPPTFRYALDHFALSFSSKRLETRSFIASSLVLSPEPFLMKRAREDDEESPDTSLSLALPGYSISTAKSGNKKMKTVKEEKSFLALTLGCPWWDEKSSRDDWEIKKRLEQSDVNSLCRLLLSRTLVKDYILPYWDENNIERLSSEGVEVTIWDTDTMVQSQMVFKLWKNKCYVFVRGWSREFVKRRHLKKGDTIGLHWDRTNSGFNFCVLDRAT